MVLYVGHPPEYNLCVTAKPRPAAPEESAPKVAAVFFTEVVAKSDKEYALLEKHSDGAPKLSLVDFQMEALIYGLHCLDRAVFAFWGADYRAAFMNRAFTFICDMFCDVMTDSQRKRFLEGFKKLCDARQLEYGAMKPVVGEDGLPKNVLPYEFSKRLCIDAGVYNPATHIVLMEWAGGIMTMMLEIAEEL